MSTNFSQRYRKLKCFKFTNLHAQTKKMSIFEYKIFSLLCTPFTRYGFDYSTDSVFFPSFLVAHIFKWTCSHDTTVDCIRWENLSVRFYQRKPCRSFSFQCIWSKGVLDDYSTKLLYMAGNKYVFSLFNNRFALLFDCHSGKSECTANWPIRKKPYRVNTIIIFRRDGETTVTAKNNIVWTDP